jgi:hypothetical protein
VNPAEEGAGRDNADQFADGAAEGLAELEELAALLRGDGDPARQLGAEDFVLGLGVLDPAGSPERPARPAEDKRGVG